MTILNLERRWVRLLVIIMSPLWLPPMIAFTVVSCLLWNAIVIASTPINWVVTGRFRMPDWLGTPDA